ncbi:hypothetical protein B0T11DRAFT_276735 [Plectosphaerella cucumerina]|uniref:Uncharacterized protein n=1 Tax=Plectosphaerella cucumerina TaxID=40658 RepID=A0A8K0TS19_9PEZI|nr:hypothetical protein B0T11DRAFT_276735 [Plectosphaerella cucumerina]
MTFSSKVMRPFKKAMEAFCERAGTGTSVDGVRWVFEEARVQPHDTPQSIGLEQGVENVIWAHLESIGGGSV